MTEPTWADDQRFLEELKAEGKVTINGVRYTTAGNLDDAFERGRKRENTDAQYYRDALREIAKILEYEEYRQNPDQVARFVEWLRMSTGNALLRQRQRAELAERKYGEQIELATQIRDLLWKKSPVRPGVTTPGDLLAIVDAVRVLLESAHNYDVDRTRLRRDNAGLQGANLALQGQAEAAERRASDLTIQVEAMKRALATERDRGYNAALADVRKAAKQIKEERA